jgi:hypothetical protein
MFSLIKLGLHANTHYQWRKKEKDFTFETFVIHIYVGFKLYKILPNYHLGEI